MEYLHTMNHIFRIKLITQYPSVFHCLVNHSQLNQQEPILKDFCPKVLPVKALLIPSVGSAPSNYIVKQSHVRLSNIVINEQFCLLTAEKLGIDVPESFVLQAGKNKTEDAAILFATKRYD